MPVAYYDLGRASELYWGDPSSPTLDLQLQTVPLSVFGVRYCWDRCEVLKKNLLAKELLAIGSIAIPFTRYA